MNKTRFYKLLILGLVTAALSGCASIPEPEGGRSLIIGKIYQTGSNYPQNNGARLNGIHKNGVILSFENIYTAERVDLKSSNGKYYSAKFPDGTFRLVNLHLEVKDSSGSNSAGMGFSSRSFTVKSNQVYNLGEIELVFDYKKGLSYQQSKVFDNVQASFFKDEESGWLNAKWNNINL